MFCNTCKTETDRPTFRSSNRCVSIINISQSIFTFCSYSLEKNVFVVANVTQLLNTNIVHLTFSTFMNEFKSFNIFIEQDPQSCCASETKCDAELSRSQFNQHFTQSFYSCRSQKHKKTLMT